MNVEAKKGESFWERRFGWFMAGSVFYGSMRLVREAIDNMATIESKMTVIQCAGAPEYLRHYAELGVGVCEQEKAILRLIAENLLRIADNARDCGNVSLDAINLQDTIREEIFGAGADARISQLGSRRASLIEELHGIHDETVRAVRRAQKEQWRSTIRRVLASR